MKQRVRAIASSGSIRPLLNSPSPSTNRQYFVMSRSSPSEHAYMYRRLVREQHSDHSQRQIQVWGLASNGLIWRKIGGSQSAWNLTGPPCNPPQPQPCCSNFRQFLSLYISEMNKHVPGTGTRGPEPFGLAPAPGRVLLDGVLMQGMSGSRTV